MPSSLDKLTIRGFKSIRSLEDFELTNLNVLIGGNGSGKSNFIDFFRMLRAMMELSLPNLDSPSLKTYIADGEESGAFLFNGPKVTPRIEVELQFGLNGYRFKLSPIEDEAFLINDEARYYEGGSIGWWDLGSGNWRPELLQDKDKQGAYGGSSVGSYVYKAIQSWQIYHFHDTSKTAGARAYQSVMDSRYLRNDASNIAPFLLEQREDADGSYQSVIEAIQLVAPFFKDFILEPDKDEKVRLEWFQKGSDQLLRPHHLSDGTLRFICLATALLQPNPPSTIIIDEPELGLHPFAMGILAYFIQAAAQRTQVIIATQSPTLIDNFDPENIITVDRENGASIFRRLDANTLSTWLEEYSMGELWRKGVLHGDPSHE